MKRKLSVAIGALVAAQLLSGCYILREISWNKDKVNDGDKTTATIGLQPTGGSFGRVAARGNGTEGRFFLFAINENSEGVDLRRPTFDSGDVTNQKEKLTRDNALRDLAADGGCPIPIAFARQGPFSGGKVWRTDDDVSSATNKFVDAKLKAKVAQDAPDGGFFGLIASGIWVDDGDGVPEDPDSTDDEIDCTGFTTTTFQVKGTEPPAP